MGDETREMSGGGCRHERRHGKAECLFREEDRVESSSIKLTGSLHL